MSSPIKVLGTVRSIKRFSTDVYRVDFAVPSRATRFRPGQFLHLALDSYDPTGGFWPESRVFSIASRPQEDRVTIVYSVKGNFTHRMEQELAVGAEFWLKLPYGDFTVSPTFLNEGPVVLIAGGTGVSPFVPFLQGGWKSGQVVLYYGVGQPEHFLFREHYAKWLGYPEFKLNLFSETLASIEPYLRNGRLSLDVICNEMGVEEKRAHYFLSGPPGMIEGFRKGLSNRGIPLHQIHIDEWE